MTTTGTVTHLKVYGEIGVAMVEVGGWTFVLWSGFEATLEKLLWFSLLKEALLSGRTVRIDHGPYSALPEGVWLLST